MFSVLDAVMDQPMDRVLAELPVTDAIRDALVSHAGDMGDALRCVIAYERGDWDQVRYAYLDNDAIVECYLRAIEWAADLGADLSVA
jgi:EAL and modified HD-GYP domain-containing signal transduction protein